ncbi:MAG: Holliday junction resolvase RuvX [Herpetosiphon sp.]
MNEAGRIVTLDIGTKRIGVAVCDPTRTVARTAGMIAAQPVERAIRDIVRVLLVEEATELLIGVPWTMEGTVGPQAERVLRFVDQLRPHVHIPLIFYDERLTSAEAERMLNDRGGFSRKDRDAGKVDELAALLILQDYLQEQRFLLPRLPEEDWDR